MIYGHPAIGYTYGKPQIKLNPLSFLHLWKAPNQTQSTINHNHFFFINPRSITQNLGKSHGKNGGTHRPPRQPWHWELMTFSRPLVPSVPVRACLGKGMALQEVLSRGLMGLMWGLKVGFMGRHGI